MFHVRVSLFHLPHAKGASIVNIGLIICLSISQKYCLTGTLFLVLHWEIDTYCMFFFRTPHPLMFIQFKTSSFLLLYNIPEWSYALALLTVFLATAISVQMFLLLLLLSLLFFFIRQAKLLQKLPDLLQDPENTWRFP